MKWKRFNEKIKTGKNARSRRETFRLFCLITVVSFIKPGRGEIIFLDDIRK
jgi:hypothetical protein